LTSPSLTKLNILLVEDDSDDVMFFKEALQKLDIISHVTIATTCEALFDDLEIEVQYDLIFLDINLPLMNGKDCLKHIKGSEKYKEIPIIMFTGSSEENDVNHSFDNGAHYHVVKPYAHSNYVESLRIVMSHNWKEKQSRPPKDQFLVNFTFN
jgi:CheY-like chemotaxis protein